MVVFRGWRLFGIAGTIVVYVAGILLLSIISLQNSSQRRPRFQSFRDRDLMNLRRREMIKSSSVLNALNWCRPLTFTDGTPMRIEPPPPKKPPVQTGHLRRSKLKAVLSSTGGNGTTKADDGKKQQEKLRPNEIGNQIRYDLFYSRTRRKQEAERLKAIRERLTTTTTTTAKTAKTEETGLTALASFPGSGNTWLRYLLQQATGFLTGSVYMDLGLSHSGFPAENIHNSSVLVVKTHEYGPQAFKMFKQAILLVRDPEQAILAEFNRQSAGHVGVASPERYTRTEGRYWNQFVVNKLWLWEHTNLSWAKEFTGRLKIIFYEDLVQGQDLETTLRDILQFINGTARVDEELLACTLERKEGIYRRRKRILHFDPFTKEMHERIAAKRKEVYGKLGR